MCSLLSSIHENNCFLFFKRYHMNIYPSATQKLPPTLWTISRASIARMSKSPRRGHIACEFWKIEDVAFIFSVYFMALWTFAYDHGYRNCDRAGSASTRWVGAVVQGPCGRRSWGEMVGLVSLVPGMRPAGRTKRDPGEIRSQCYRWVNYYFITWLSLPSGTFFCVISTRSCKKLENTPCWTVKIIKLHWSWWAQSWQIKC